MKLLKVTLLYHWWQTYSGEI